MEQYVPAGGDDVDPPGRGDLIDALDTHASTSFIVYPSDDDLEWSCATSKNISAFGSFELDRYDPAAGEHGTIADDILAWISRR